jgi:hypothetical protein
MRFLCRLGRRYGGWISWGSQRDEHGGEVLPPLVHIASDGLNDRLIQVDEPTALLGYEFLARLDEPGTKFRGQELRLIQSRADALFRLRQFPAQRFAVTVEVPDHRLAGANEDSFAPLFAPNS